MAASTITTNLGRNLLARVADSNESVTSRELALLQSAAISGGTDITLGWSTSDGFTEISSSGGYSRKDISGSYSYSGAPSSSPTRTIAEQTWTASGGSFDDFDMVAEIWTRSSDSAEIIIQTFATTSSPVSLNDGDSYKTGSINLTEDDK